MRTETREMLVTYLTFCEYQLDEAQRHWDTAWERIRANQNSTNVMGVWQHEQLGDLAILRTVIVERDRACRELRDFIEKPKSRFRHPKKVPKARKNKAARL